MFSKLGPARYISHLDLMKAFERSLKRAALPVALTQGFNPHPVMSFAAPVPVGMDGEKEYLDMELTEAINSEQVKAALRDMLPEGLGVKNVRQVDQSAPSPMAVVNRASYEAVGWETDLSIDELNSAINEFLNSQQIIIERKNKKTNTIKAVDIRPGIYSMKTSVSEQGVPQLKLELAIGSAANVRPEDVISALSRFNPQTDLTDALICRTGLYVKNNDGIKSLWEV
jgi:radical SAM-linked protein